MWRLLYKLPLNKRAGDLQWRILHGAVAVNSFISVIKPTSGKKCPFCDATESIFHCFFECQRLKPLFTKLTLLFEGFDEFFSETAFIFGAGYQKGNPNKWKLLNFIVGEAKIGNFIKAGRRK